MNWSTGYIYALSNGVLQESPLGCFSRCPARTVTVAHASGGFCEPGARPSLCSPLVLPPPHDSGWQVLITPILWGKKLRLGEMKANS